MQRRPSRPLLHAAATPPAPRSSRVGLVRPGGTRPEGHDGHDGHTRPASRLEMRIEHHLEQLRMRTGTARPGVVDDATARCDPPTQPFSALAGVTAPAPRRAPSSVSARTSPRSTALMPAIAT